MIVDVQRAFEPPPAFVDKVRRYSRRFHCRVFTKYLNSPGSMLRRVLKQKSGAPGYRTEFTINIHRAGIPPNPHEF